MIRLNENWNKINQIVHKNIEDLKDRYSVNYKMGLVALQKDYSVSLPMFMHYLQESALLHTFSVHNPKSFYNKDSLAWVLTHWQVKILRYPKFEEEIEVFTWPSAFKLYFGERGFLVKNKKGEDLAFANSSWILLNRPSLKPERVSDDMKVKFGKAYPFLLDKDFKLPKIKDPKLIYNGNYSVTRRDIDTNYHVNNTKYIEWIYDYLPNDIYNNFRAETLKVVYKKEVLKEDIVTIDIYEKRDDGYIQIVATISKNNTIATEIYCNFKPLAL